MKIHAETVRSMSPRDLLGRVAHSLSPESKMRPHHLGDVGKVTIANDNTIAISARDGRRFELRLTESK